MKNTALFSMTTFCLVLLCNYVSGQTGNYFAGTSAGAGNTGNNNTYVGYTAASLSPSGSYNTYLGNSAGFRSTTGNFNTYLGTYSGYSLKHHSTQSRIQTCPSRNPDNPVQQSEKLQD